MSQREREWDIRLIIVMVAVQAAVYLGAIWWVASR